MAVGGSRLVVDTSAVLAVILGEDSRAALIAATRGTSLMAAPSLPWEVGNALIAGQRRGRLSATAVQLAWSSYRKVPVSLVEIDTSLALESAIRHRLYAYDAYVLEAARSLGCPLLTLDRGLARAATSEGVVLMEWRA